MMTPIKDEIPQKRRREILARITRDLKRMAFPQKRPANEPLVIGAPSRVSPLVVMKVDAQVLLEELEALKFLQEEHEKLRKETNQQISGLMQERDYLRLKLQQIREI
jgi:hypothetical protein